MTRAEQIDDVRTGQHIAFLQTGKETGGRLLQAEVRLDPGGWVPRHAHLRQDERVEVLAGSLTVRVGGAERVLGVGESADVPRRKVHLVRNAGAGDARFLLEVRPARRMEAAMRGVFRVMAMASPLTRLRRSRRR